MTVKELKTNSMATATAKVVAQKKQEVDKNKDKKDQPKGFVYDIYYMINIHF